MYKRYYLIFTVSGRTLDTSTHVGVEDVKSGRTTCQEDRRVFGITGDGDGGRGRGRVAGLRSHG